MSLLRSLLNGVFYIGATQQLKRRLQAHNKATTGFTAKHAPWHLIGCEYHATMADARKREAALKRSLRMCFLFKKRMLSRTESVGNVWRVVG